MASASDIEGSELFEHPTEGAATFQLTTPLLREGRSHHFLAVSEHMSVAIKCYASGGENSLHTHHKEDHVFVVLQGRARFYDRDGGTLELGRNGGILIARGWCYRFESCSDNPLVMMRIGATDGSMRQLVADRLAPDGHYMSGTSEENRWQAPVLIEGAFYR